MLQLKIIVGSIRPTRNADRVAPWVGEKARAHGGFEVEGLDLRDWPLPLFQEHVGSIGDFNDPTYSDPIVRRWNRTIKEADAFIIVTPEYLHSVPGVLKNALDNVFVSFALRNKPLGMVAYSIGVAGGARALEHLVGIAVESEMVPLRDSVLIPRVEAAFDEHGQPADPTTLASVAVMLDDLRWWGELLAKGRAEGELPPGTMRIRAAIAELAATR